VGLRRARLRKVHCAWEEDHAWVRGRGVSGAKREEKKRKRQKRVRLVSWQEVIKARRGQGDPTAWSKKPTKMWPNRWCV
jgi:hypothetical protein